MKFYSDDLLVQVVFGSLPFVNIFKGFLFTHDAFVPNFFKIVHCVAPIVNISEASPIIPITLCTLFSFGAFMPRLCLCMEK